MKSIQSLGLAATVCLLSVSGASATNLLSNGSFEDPNIGVSNYTYPSGVYGGWTYAGGALVNAQGYSAWYGGAAPAGQDGLQFSALQGTSTLSQSFVADNTNEFITWFDAGRPYFGSSNGDQSYNVLINGTVVDTESTLSGQAFTARGRFLPGFVIGNSYTLSFAGLANTDETAFIDNVAVNAAFELGPVPEPATWLLMVTGFGLAGVALRRNRMLLKTA
jgi:hypothetical protein